ncbi:FG-GAP repeat protein [Marinicella litoralis]|nr:FG-GAP repeat protein [Marinicella litoralis]
MLLLTLFFQINAHAQPGPEQRIEASDGHIRDRFGHAIDIEGDFAVIGAPGFDVPHDPAPGTHLRAGAAYVFRYVGGQWIEFQKLTAQTPSQDDFFGMDVAIKRNFIVIGAPGDDEATGGATWTDSGAAYIFEWNGTDWQQIEKLLPDDSATSAAIQMGTSVDIDISIPDVGNLPEQTIVVVGAPLFGGSHGVIFLYRQANDLLWERLGDLQDDDTATDERGHLGTSIALFGDLLLGGAPNHQFGQGAAYPFNRDQIISSWVQSTPIEPASLLSSDQFGISSAVGRIGDEYIAGVGASGVSANHIGRVFIYDLMGEHEFTELGTQKYGHSVAIHQNHLAIGAFGDDSTATNAGAVFLKIRDGSGVWQDNGMMTATDADVDKQFGLSVALDDGVLAIGAPSFNTIPRSGAAYFYTSLIFSNGFDANSNTTADSTIPCCD